MHNFFLTFFRQQISTLIFASRSIHKIPQFSYAYLCRRLTCFCHTDKTIEQPSSSQSYACMYVCTYIGGSTYSRIHTYVFSISREFYFGCAANSCDKYFYIFFIQIFLGVSAILKTFPALAPCATPHTVAATDADARLLSHKLALLILANIFELLTVKVDTHIPTPTHMHAYTGR